MSNPIIIPNRLNWIDWAKVFAITFVVFGHIPQEPGSFPQYYIVTFHMPLFFFISGYLTKKELFNKATMKKYWHTLIIPYFCYNIIFYPYWIVRHVIDCPQAEWYDFIKPLIGIFMLQCETPYFESLNGVTWFIVSLLGYKIILSICNMHKYGKYFMPLLAILAAIAYVLNEFHLYTKDLPPIGFIKCLPFFYLGHLCKQKGIISDKPNSKDWYLCPGWLCCSLICYLIPDQMSNIPLFALRFWSVSICGTMGVLSFCKLLDHIHSKIIDNISIGTIVIMGLHFMMIGTTNFVLEKAFGLEDRIIYPWYIAAVLSMFFIALLYPLIILFINKYPFMLGKGYTTKTVSDTR